MMKNILIKFTLSLCLLLSIHTFSSAVNVSGYIVNENQDTLYGLIKLHRHNLTGVLIINGYDLESLYYEVNFKATNTRKFLTYTPDIIISFGFILNDIDYVFTSFLLEYNSVFKKAIHEQRFLKLIYSGQINLYENKIFVDDPAKSSFAGDYLTYNEYYIFNENVGISRVAVTDDYSNIRDMLRYCKADEGYVQKVPLNVEFTDILTVLKDYDHWLLINSKL